MADHAQRRIITVVHYKYSSVWNVIWKSTTDTTDITMWQTTKSESIKCEILSILFFLDLNRWIISKVLHGICFWNQGFAHFHANASKFACRYSCVCVDGIIALSKRWLGISCAKTKKKHCVFLRIGATTSTKGVFCFVLQKRISVSAWILLPNEFEECTSSDGNLFVANSLHSLQCRPYIHNRYTHTHTKLNRKVHLI